MRERETGQQETAGPGQGEIPSIYLFRGGDCPAQLTSGDLGLEGEFCVMVPRAPGFT